MTGTRSILDRIRLAAGAGRVLPPEDGRALARAIEGAERDGISIDAALGLVNVWQRAAHIRRRNDAIRAMASTIPGSNPRSIGSHRGSGAGKIDAALLNATAAFS